MNRTYWALVVLALTNLTCPAAEKPLAVLRTETATIAVAGNGTLQAVTRNSDGRNYLAPGQLAPLLSVRVGGTVHAPDSAAWDEGVKRLTLRFSKPEVLAVVSAEAKPTHVVFELVELQPTNRVELVLWGPYPTTIGDIIGEVVGVVRDQEFAVGIQALNAKTLGGYPTTENDIEADYTADDTGDYPDLPAELKKGPDCFAATPRDAPNSAAWCRRSAATVTGSGSSPTGATRNISPRLSTMGVWSAARSRSSACPAARRFETIGAIEVAEGLPHPMLDGVWAKVATNANCSYLIVDFSENNVERAIEMTKRAGLNYLYHSSPFETWGHFELKPSLFPHGWDGFRTCVEKARKAGVRIGFHTLSNFITPNDRLCHPETRSAPGSHRRRVSLTAEVDAEQKEIPVAAPEFFRKKTDMNTVVIGEELVRYGSVSAEAPWRLLDCQRGSWGTPRPPHAANASVGQADGPRLQGVPHRCGAHAGGGAEYCEALQRYGRTADFSGWPGGRLVHGLWPIWPHDVHQGLV